MSNQPNVRDVWVLCTYAEKAPDGQHINYCHTLFSSLGPSLSKVRKMFPDDEFYIVARNIDDEDILDCDFAIIQKSSGQGIGEIEYWSSGYDSQV